MEPRRLREGKVVEIPLCTTGFKHHPKRWLFLGFSWTITSTWYHLKKGTFRKFHRFQPSNFQGSFGTRFFGGAKRPPQKAPQIYKSKELMLQIQRVDATAKSWWWWFLTGSFFQSASGLKTSWKNMLSFWCHFLFCCKKFSGNQRMDLEVGWLRCTWGAFFWHQKKDFGVGWLACKNGPTLWYWWSDDNGRQGWGVFFYLLLQMRS